MEADELVNEIQRTIKALLGIGARLPKELMLFIKNMVFLDGAIATLAPDLDIIAEIGAVSMHFATVHGERLAGELGLDPDSYELDLSGVRASFGYEAGTEGAVTYRDLQARRDIIRNRLQKRSR
jgi:ubiquinone biosynthesis protein